MAATRFATEFRCEPGARSHVLRCFRRHRGRIDDEVFVEAYQNAGILVSEVSSGNFG